MLVAGGGVAGLCAAREAAKLGASVVVLEEDLEVGLPEKCDGLVSAKALSELGVTPTSRMVADRVKRAVLHGPRGALLEVDARRQGVVVLDRRELDRELARLAAVAGAELLTGHRVTRVKAQRDYVLVETSRGRWSCQVYIEARGAGFLPLEGRPKVLSATRYDVVGDWFERGVVEVHLDQEATPGFFRWVIPYAPDLAKVGAAGHRIDPQRTLDRFLEGRAGRSVVLKRISAPIVVDGPIDRFVEGRVVRVGDAAAQTKPTTAGGIYTGGMAGLLAGQAAGLAVSEKDMQRLALYEAGWRHLFGREFRLMRYGRRLFEALDNEGLERLLRVGADVGLGDRLSVVGDFDLHSRALLTALGLRGLATLLRALLGAEFKVFLEAVKSSGEKSLKEG